MNENRFASGWKRSYYGKGDVTVYRLNRAEGSLFAANVMLLIYGDAFWPTYTTGDNTGLVATDSMKNFIQRETLNFAGSAWRSIAASWARSFSPLIRKRKARRSRRWKSPMRGGRQSVRARGSGARLRPAGDRARRPGGSALGNRRLSSAAAGRQRLPGIHPRSIHHAARVEGPAAAHVARSGVELCRI